MRTKLLDQKVIFQLASDEFPIEGKVIDFIKEGGYDYYALQLDKGGVIFINSDAVAWFGVQDEQDYHEEKLAPVVKLK